MNRTLQKTCTYAVMHFTVAIIVAFALTRSWRIALAVGLVEPFVQTIAFAIHERLWARGGRLESLGAPPCAHGALFAKRTATTA